VETIFQVMLVAVAGLAVAVADMLIKKVGIASVSYWQALFQPLMGAVAVLYGLQVILFAYVFARRGQLGIVALVQTAVYAIVCVLLGRLIFDEQITLVKSLGMILAFSGVVLMNL
jgi:drug/metabolite transporter (DMT)-like permease